MSVRDYAMARLSAALVQIEWCKTAVEGCLEDFVDPTGDEQGEERSELLDEALAACHGVATAVQGAKAAIDQMPEDELELDEDSIELELVDDESDEEDESE